ncbi:T9SS type A sorting domain-containing protein [Psychroflexus sediminis]|uniref:Por secretion system C-terminal sorting domain-containing protein n=1 Tax=Psychroflexus sediminis TaxID=470826 RepID=A0A1G7XSM3_9FLAO|nr:T9SS type A sorting domain-containing protein [Psychroflexus sediminis]SDG87178.1 Por secretion system C-terminal sorting domain-containing protein [Psychroflexus sediminis]
MNKLILLFLVFLSSHFSYGQTEIKTMFYNVLNFSSAPPRERLDILNSILNTYEPDLFMVSEVESASDAQNILDESFRYTTANIVQAPFLPNPGAYINQTAYYNADKFKLNSTAQIETNYRSINHYSFELKTNSKIAFEVFVAHFKASSGQFNENERLYEAQQFIKYIEGFPSGTNIMLAGDFNMYSSSEPAFQTLLNGTNTINMLDPINSLGDWHNNLNFTGIHTQSTRLSNVDFADYGAGGGLDDRFDMMLISDALNSPTNSISFIQGSYKAWGNNGNCFNDNINSIDCAGTFDQELRGWLYMMSDHLPVVMSLNVKEELLSTNEFVAESPVKLTNGNLVSDRLALKFSPNLLSEKVIIYNTLGQEIYSFKVSSLEFAVDVSTLSSGLYFLKVNQTPITQKFYINH